MTTFQGNPVQISISIREYDDLTISSVAGNPLCGASFLHAHLVDP